MSRFSDGLPAEAKGRQTGVQAQVAANGQCPPRHIERVVSRSRRARMPLPRPIETGLKAPRPKWPGLTGMVVASAGFGVAGAVGQADWGRDAEDLERQEPPRPLPHPGHPSISLWEDSSPGGSASCSSCTVIPGSFLALSRSPNSSARRLPGQFEGLCTGRCRPGFPRGRAQLLPRNGSIHLPGVPAPYSDPGWTRRWRRSFGTR
jgi:hypothetical protein